MKRSLLILSLALALTAAAPPAHRDPLAPVTSRGNPTEKKLSAIVSEYARGLFASQPSFATTWGIHAYDSKLEDASKPAIDREVARTRRLLAAAKAIRASQLSDS